MATGEGGTPRDADGLLLTTALYRENGFRILGLSVTALAREVQREAEKLKMAERLGATSPRSQAAFGLNPMPGTSTIREASRRLADPVLRTRDEFFWFWPLSWDRPRDVAIEAIAGGRGEIAEATWRKLISEPHAVHNLAVLEHMRALDLESIARPQTAATAARPLLEARWRSALELWHAFDTAANPVVWNALERHLTQTVGDRVPADLVEQLRTRLGTLLLGLNTSLMADGVRVKGSLETSLHSRLLREQRWGQQAAMDAGEAATRAPLSRIRTLCDQHEESDLEERRSKLSGVIGLLDEVEPTLNAIAGLLPATSPSLMSVADRVANLVRLDMIPFANSTEDWSSVEPVLRRLRRLARGAAARESIASDLATVVVNRIGAEAARIMSGTADGRQKVSQLQALATSLLGAQRAEPIATQSLGEALDVIAVKMNDIAVASFQAKRFDVAGEALLAGEATCVDKDMKSKFVQGQVAIRSYRHAQRNRRILAVVGIAAAVVIIGGGASSTLQTALWGDLTTASTVTPRQAAAPRTPAPSRPSLGAPPVLPSTDSDRVEVGGIENGQTGSVLKQDMPRLNELKRQILEDRQLLLRYRRQIDAIGVELESEDSRIKDYKNTLHQVELQANRGLEVDRDRYEHTLTQANNAVEQYNAALERRRSLVRQHDALIDSINKKVEEHNSYIHVTR